jgi:alpha-L-fucosidase
VQDAWSLLLCRAEETDRLPMRSVVVPPRSATAVPFGGIPVAPTRRSMSPMVLLVSSTVLVAAAAPPSADVLAFQRLATTQFIHFSMCTFHDCEQDKRPIYPAASFAPTGQIDTDQWLGVATSWGAEQVCLTAHHSGGFALWQTNTTDYGVRQSPYMGGTADIVQDFMASCRKFGVSPCLYFVPAEDGALDQQNSTAYLATQLAMLRELLTRYGHIDRIWFDLWGDACGRFGSGCPKGALDSPGYDKITALVRSLSPRTVMLPGVDGCLSDVAVENGEATYPSWSYASSSSPGQGNPANPVVCRQVLPNSSGAVFAAHEVDQTIMNPGDHWFWDSSHPSLQAPQLFQYYLNTVGRGSNWILNVPPDRTGSIPPNFATEMSKLGAALNASGLGSGPGSSAAVANASQAAAVGCAASEVVLTIPSGAVVDALQLREDLTSGQHIARYTLELRQLHVRQSSPHSVAAAAAEWVPITDGVHGGTVGSQLIDLLIPVRGPASLRWRCGAAIPAGVAVRLSSMSALKLQPPAGWQRPVTTTWALQTLYSTTVEDMTPCATRSGVALSRAAVENENRSSCRAYLSKAGANFSYVRDEHCCLSPPPGTAAPHGLVPLYLQASVDDRDHMLSPNKSFTFDGRRYITHGPECYGFPASGHAMAAQGAQGVVVAPPSAPLDVYWSASRKDLWSLASEASRAQAIALGYVLAQKEVARVPTSC